MTEIIVRNRARCLVCGDIIESEDRRHFVTCNCGNLSVDGGQDYIRRGYRDGTDSYIDDNIVARATDDVPISWYYILARGLREMLDVDPDIRNIEVTPTRVNYAGGNPMRRDLIADAVSQMFAEVKRYAQKD